MFPMVWIKSLGTQECKYKRKSMNEWRFRKSYCAAWPYIYLFYLLDAKRYTLQMNYLKRNVKVSMKLCKYD